MLFFVFRQGRRRIHGISISITPTIELVLLGKWSLCCVREKRTFGQTTVHSAPRGSHASRSLECRPSVSFIGEQGLRERTGLIAQFSEMRFLERQNESLTGMTVGNEKMNLFGRERTDDE